MILGSQDSQRGANVKGDDSKLMRPALSGEGRCMNTLHVVLVEGALIAAISIRYEWHGYGIRFSHRVDERVRLKALGGPYAGCFVDKSIAICAVDVIAASGELRSTGLFDSCNNLQLNPSFLVHKCHFVDNRSHNLQLVVVNHNTHEILAKSYYILYHNSSDIKTKVTKDN